MANSLTTNPIVIDTVAADVTLSSQPLNIKAITFYSTDAADGIVLADVNDVPIAQAFCNGTNETVHLHWDGGFRTGAGAKVDLSASTLAGTFRALIYI
jgi:hypothetical protein